MLEKERVSRTYHLLVPHPYPSLIAYLTCISVVKIPQDNKSIRESLATESSEFVILFGKV